MDKNTAADAIRRLSQHYAAMVEAADILDKLGSFDQAEEAAKARLAMLHAEEIGVKADIAAAEGHLADVTLEAQERVEKARAEAQETAHAAEVRAQAALADAQARASGIVAGASEEAEKVLANARERATKQDAETQAAAAAAAFHNDLVTRAKADLEELEARIAAAREQAAKILAG